MTARNATFETKGECELVMTRVFDAPRELVFKAWTEPDRLMRWWGPKDWTTPVCTVDLRPEGIWHYCMRSKDGQESLGRAIYREIIEPERLVYSDAFSDREGHVLSQEMVITLTFETQAGSKTLLTGHTLFETAAHRDSILGMGMEQGMNDSLDRLAEHLAE